MNILIMNEWSTIEESHLNTRILTQKICNSRKLSYPGYSQKSSANTRGNYSIIYPNHFSPVLNIQDKQLFPVAVGHAAWLGSSCRILIQNVSPVYTQQSHVLPINGPVQGTCSTAVVELDGLWLCYPCPVVVSPEIDNQWTPAALKLASLFIFGRVSCRDSSTLDIVPLFVVDSQYKLDTLIIFWELDTRLKRGPIRGAIRVPYEYLQFLLSTHLVMALVMLNTA